MSRLREGRLMHVVADRIFPSEPCWGLQEGPEQRVVHPNGGQEMRWVQRLWVIRGDRKAKFEPDSGPASDFPDATPVIYPSFGENTVAQLQWLPGGARRNDQRAQRGEGRRGESDLLPAH